MQADTPQDGKRASNWLDQGWRKPAKCASSGCVEARMDGERITVRNSRDPGGDNVSYDRDEWEAFVAAVKAGEFDVA